MAADINTGYREIFNLLKKILQKYEKKLSVQTDTDDNYVLLGNFLEN